MIKLDLPGPKDGSADPLWTRWRKDCKIAKDALIQCRERGEGDPVELRPKLWRRRTIVRRYYLAGKHGEAFAPFYGKCVYCEAFGIGLRVDHFRPKKSVAGVSAHPGYYWLVYEVENLLLACEACNNSFKHDKFPLEDEAARAWDSSDDIEKEAPVLINPFVDDPSEHMSVVVKTGVLTHKTERGRQTITLMGLNLRSLPQQRRRIILEIQNYWHQLTGPDSTDEERNQAREHLRNSEEGRFEYTLTARVLIAQLREHVRSFLATD